MPTDSGPWKRRSERLSIAIPLYVSSLDPRHRFAQICETVSVNNHGCVIRFPEKVDTGEELRLDIPHTNRRAQARVVRVEPADPGRNIWHIALELESAENFWGLRFPPVDWAGHRETPATPSAPSPAPLPRPGAISPESPARAAGQGPQASSPALRLETALEEVRQTKARLDALLQKANETLEARIGQALTERVGELQTQLEQRWRELAEARPNNSVGAPPPNRIDVPALLEQLQKQFPQMASQIAAGVSTQLTEMWEQSRQSLVAAVETRLGEIRRTETHLREMAEQLAAQLREVRRPEESLRGQLATFLGEELARARTRLSQELAATRDQHLHELDEQIHKKTVQTVEQWMKVATAVDQRSRQWSEQLPQHEAQIGELLEQLRTAGQTLAQRVDRESERFSTLLQERLLDATGQLKGQTQFAVEMTRGLSQEYRERIEKEVAEAVGRRLESSSQQQSAELETRLTSLRAEVEQSFRTACEGILREATAELDVSTRDLSLRYVRTLESKTSEILAAMADAVRERLRQSGWDQPPGPGGEGETGR